MDSKSRVKTLACPPCLTTEETDEYIHWKSIKIPGCQISIQRVDTGFKILVLKILQLSPIAFKCKTT